jgi:integrase/recombinase XerD
MNTLRQALEDYLTIRRSLGFKLEKEGRVLAAFVTHAHAAGADTITTEHALAWATLPADTSPGWWATRLRMVRGFARYLQTIDPVVEVPPAKLLIGRNRRPVPYLYSDHDVAALLAAARTLSPALKSATVQTVIGLLAVTGLRIGEVRRLDGDDIDWAGGLLKVRESKFGKSRLVPLHPSTVEALRSYCKLRDRLCSRPSAPSLFVSTRGGRLAHSSIYPAFRELLTRTGLDQPSSARRPRLHDFRHSFAVKTLLGWYRDGADVAAHLPLLSTYLGHVDPAATYWYLSAAPELLGLAAERLQRARQEQP